MYIIALRVLGVYCRTWQESLRQQASLGSTILLIGSVGSLYDTFYMGVAKHQGLPYRPDIDMDIDMDTDIDIHTAIDMDIDIDIAHYRDTYVKKTPTIIETAI